MDATPLEGATIVVVGVTGQVAEPLACALARHNEVVGAARFKDPEARRRLEAAGVRAVPVDLATQRANVWLDLFDRPGSNAVATTRTIASRTARIGNTNDLRQRCSRLVAA
jgi:nucleoside-diphosphate-sugar epimerase